MGRPKKLNLTQNSDFNYNVTIVIGVRSISIDSDEDLFTDYIYYTDSYMFELPSIKVLTKQFASLLHCSESRIIIKSISI